jgi:UDP-N-acetylmuramyl tripeptide synthase
LARFIPAFGRQEVIKYKDKKVQLFLSKNPISFNQSYTTIKDLGAKILLLVLNDRIPDGRDISWIWDVDMPGLDHFEYILIAGDRVYDMALRIKYDIQNSDFRIQNIKSKLKIYTNLKKAIEEGIRLTVNDDTLFVLPTYSAMLEVRKIITGKKIL